jgi:hypothetical protein
MHMSLSAPCDPFQAITVWREGGNDRGPVVFLHLGDHLSILMSPEELGQLTAVLLHAIEDTPLPAPVVETIPLTYE